MVTGSSAEAVALAVAAFLAGLAAGAALGGRVARRSGRPLRLLALLEVSAAGCGLAFPAVLGALGALHPAAAFLVAALPPVFMGAVLPVAVEAVEAAEGDRLGRTVGVLYAANTLGAVGGAALAGLWGLARLGLEATELLAVGANLAVAASALGLAWLGAPGARTHDPTVRRMREAATGGGPDPRRTAALVLAACLLGGAASTGAEVAWARALAFVEQGFAREFARMLALHLAGLAAGSLAAALVVDRAPAAGSLALAQALLGAALAWSAVEAGRLPHMVPASVLAGMVLPLAARAVAAAGRSARPAVGLAQAVGVA
ncbi:MAG: hypothetical protein HY722_10435, partial [Planctomycetes bacterium]|nr:hypothetical protein [Planctomycetota bacterium]